MPRRERIVEAGMYHIINRGVERQNIFLDDSDYEFFLELLLKLTKVFDVVIHSYFK